MIRAAQSNTAEARESRAAGNIELPVVVFILCDQAAISPEIASALGNFVVCVNSLELTSAILKSMVGAPPLAVQKRDNVAKVPGHRRKVTLAVREKAVMDLLVLGDTYQEIAMRLGCKYSTVRTYVSRIYRKLGVHSRGCAVAKYIGIAGAGARGGDRSRNPGGSGSGIPASPAQASDKKVGPGRLKFRNEVSGFSSFY